MDFITIAFITTVLLLTTMLAIHTFFLYRKFKKTVDTNTINLQRERIENEVYRLTDIMTSDETQLIDTNHLVLKIPWSDNSNNNDNDVPNYNFFTTLGINFEETKKRERTALVLMPFNNTYRNLYNTIKETCRLCRIKCYRSDEFTEPGLLLKQIITSIIESEIIFAVVDGRNPNVFYEIGIAHSLGKRVYLLAHYSGRNTLPFDINSSRVIIYKNYSDLSNQLKKVLDRNET